MQQVLPWWVGICAAAGVEFDALALHVITAPSLPLDHEPDCDALRETVARLRPRLLVLNPFVRLHRVNENDTRSRSSTLSTMRQHPELRATGRARARGARRWCADFLRWLVLDAGRSAE